MHNIYIQFDKNNKFNGFNIQMLRQEPHLIDEEYTEKVPKIVKKRKDAKDPESPMIEVVEYVDEKRTRKVQAKDNNGKLIFDIIEETSLPENAFIITAKQHEEYLTALNSQLKDVILINRKIEIVDKFTDDELREQKLEQDKQTLITQAQQLLSNNDYRQTKALLGLYTDEKKDAVLSYMEALREVIREAKQGNLTDLPTATF